MSHDALKDLLALLQLTEQLADGRALEDALRAVTETALAILPGDHASIRLADASGTELLASVRAGTGRDTPTLSLRVGEGIAGWVLAHGKPARVVDVALDPRFLTAPGQGFAIASMVAEPLVSEGKTIGVLSISSPEPDAFSATDEVLARLLANCSVAPIQRARLERLAVTDDLTLAYNSRYLSSRLDLELERAQRTEAPLSVLLMDLDFFKRVNDRYGHDVGDQVLRAFAGRVRSATRRVDVLIRRGGEEFVLLMPGATTEQARVIAERVRFNVSQSPIAIGEKRVSQTVSIGVATWDGRESPAKLEKRADAAMYRAKERGRDRVVVAGTRGGAGPAARGAVAAKGRPEANGKSRSTVKSPRARKGPTASGGRAAGKKRR
jgi:two-component system cell cycle response regulator